MSDTFYPFVENGHNAEQDGEDDVAAPQQPARIAVYDSMTVPPRVVTVPPSDVRTYLDEITKNVWELATQQGGEWPWHIIRELVENYIHASFIEPTISIMDKGQTISFSDQGPGIPNKAAALRPTFSSATKAMKRYIRGTGSGLPMVEATVKLQHGSISIEDNLGQGAVITVSLAHKDDPMQAAPAPAQTSPSPQQGGAYVESFAQQPAQQAVSPYPAGQAQPTYAQGQPPAGAQAQPYGMYPQAPQGWQPQGWPQQPQGQYPAGAVAGQAWPAYQQNGWPAAASSQPWGMQQAQPWGPGQAQPQMQAPYGYPQGQAQQGWPAPGEGQAGLPAMGAPAPQAVPGFPGQAMPMQAAGQAAPEMSDEERQVVMLFGTLEKVGATEVSQACGLSKPTSSRRLKEMSDAGLIVKMGQKYVLTEPGRLVLEQIAQGR